MIYRIDVRTMNSPREGAAGVDPVGESIRHQIAEFGMNIGPISSSRIFLLDIDADGAAVQRIAQELLADPVVEAADVIAKPPAGLGKSRIEIHLKAGVMDPVAASTEMAIRDMGISVRGVRTGRCYLIDGQVDQKELQSIALKVLANGVVESVHFDAFIPKEFPASPRYAFEIRHIPIRGLSDEQLIRLSRDGHLFLSLDEMKAIAAYYKERGREPTDVELETLAQTWSEHCVHKTLKSAVDLEIRDEQGAVIEKKRYENLIRDTIFKSTMELIEDRQGHASERGPQAAANDFCLSVFADNAGVIAFDQTDAVCFKVETHNRPSAIDPYGGSAT